MRTDLLGIVFSNTADSLVRDLTDVRCFGSVPFGGRYRLIDFTLSNLVNAGVSKVAVMTKSNYRSLMDHLGSGKYWDLARKKGGLTIFPPFINYGNGTRNSRIDQLRTVLPLVEMSTQEYIVMSDCDVVANIDIEKLVKKHIESGSDITIAYKKGMLPNSSEGRMVFELDQNNRVTDILRSPEIDTECNYSLNIAVLKRELLIKLVRDAEAHSYIEIIRDILQPGLSKFHIHGEEITDYAFVIDSMRGYLQANLDLLNDDIRTQLFYTGRTVYTKVRDEMPVKYGLNSSCKNSLIADGCVIDGEVENSILFRGVKVSKGVKIKNSIIMQNTIIQDDSRLEYTICDKNVTITPKRIIIGYKTYPAFIKKSARV